MKLRLVLFSVLLFCFINGSDARPAIKKKKFKNPAFQFEGTWRVDSYDFREFVAVPDNLESKLKDEAAAFPVGQRIRFTWTGSAVMPGNIDPTTMKFSGPTGETLEMTLLQPFEKELCKRNHWDYLCGKWKKDYSDELMIDDITNWTRSIPPEYVKVWKDVKSLQYSLVHLGKSYHFDARIVKNGDIFILITIEGLVKGRGNAFDTMGVGDMGVRLKRIQE